ncbi:gastrin/cholecystokinin type B receptor-like [Schistocerca americana]|uniref:gastrin/cholecystokinin type B receptor-like n=1 Tax=Schistocerca americana TaxID=7009 RepID=UPI001F4F65CC|nr:gastrin/cholecystokinin type B receptor-like [Schistocerca americana]
MGESFSIEGVAATAATEGIMRFLADQDTVLPAVGAAEDAIDAADILLLATALPVNASDDGAPGKAAASNSTAASAAAAALEVVAVRHPLYVVVPMTVLYAIIFFTGVLGNMTTCIVIYRNKHMHTTTNYYLFSLAVSDLLLLVSGLPPEVYQVWKHYPYIFGLTFCRLRGLAAETSSNATVLTITAFTVERYVAICHPFLSHTMSKLSRAVKLIVAVWLLSLACAVPQALHLQIVGPPGMTRCMFREETVHHLFEISTFLFFVAPMTLITILYALIGLRLRRSSAMKRDAGPYGHRNGSGTGHQHYGCVATAADKDGAQLQLSGVQTPRHHHAAGRASHSSQSRRVLKMLVAVVVAFFICWAPFHAQRLVAMYVTAGAQRERGPSELIYAIVTYTSGILYYVSTTINPILYQIMSHKFREAFKDTLGRCCGLRGQRARRAYSILSRSAPRHASAAHAAAAAGGRGGGAGGGLGGVGAGGGARCGESATATDCSGNSEQLRSDAASGSASASGSGSCGGYSVVVSASARHHGGYEAVVVPALSRQSTRASSRPFLSSGSSAALPTSPPPMPVASGRRRSHRNGKRSRDSWRLLRCLSTSSEQSLEQLPPCYLPEPITAESSKEQVCPRRPNGEAITMLPVSLSNNSNNVSNSSLRDVEHGALEDELSAYMEELNRRERC